jgi:SAM-dependent methyltransferase
MKEDFSKLTNYDDIASDYLSNIEGELSWNNLYERPYMLSIFDDMTGKNVLDAGCGSGFYSFHAANQNANVTAVDASGKMLKHIEGLDKAKKIKLVKADLGKGLPFIESCSQDYIISSLAMHYLENWYVIVNEFERVLKKSGRLYISTHHPFADHLHLEKSGYFDKYFVEDTWGVEQRSYKVRYFTRSLTDILKPFLRSGLRLINVEEPLPNERCRELSPRTYERLMNRPGFLFLTLEK